MIKKYKIDITNAALQDMKDLYDHISNVLQAPETALKQYNRIAGRILTLDIFPERFKLTGCDEIPVLRSMPVDNYLVFFVITYDRVIVTNVLYSASDIKNRLIKK